MEKFLLFTTGNGSADPLNWSSDEAALYSARDFRGMRPASSKSMDLFFHTDVGREVITIDIKNNTHVKIMYALGNAISSSSNSVISVADVDNNSFIHRDIYGVTIRPQENYIQSLTNNSRTAITCPRDNYNSLIIANIDGSAAVACTLELHDGTTYSKILDQISIPAKQSLVLEKNEISFDRTTYTLHATSGDSDGQLTFTFNY